MASKFCAAALLIANAYSQSISSCGGSADHMQNVVVKVSPDPPEKGKSITLTISGTLDEDFGAGSADVDLDVKALGIIDKSIKLSSPFSLTPAFAKGPQSVTVGPFTLPSLPGSVALKGTVKLVNDKTEPVACVNLNLDMPALKLSSPETASVDAVQNSNCGKSTDHLKNIQISSSGGVRTVTGNLDETITTGTAHVDLKIHEIISIPVSMDIPFALSPGLPSGDFNFTSGPSTLGNLEAPLVDISGTVTVDDGNKEEICCINVESSGKVDVEDVANPTHYGDPKTGCKSDEQSVQVQGVTGDFCSPACKKSACPTDVPSGVTAEPQCALKTTTGAQYCALICTPSELRSNGAKGECGSGSCQPVQGLGLCTYASSSGKASTLLTLADELQVVV